MPPFTERWLLCACSFFGRFRQRRHTPRRTIFVRALEARRFRKATVPPVPPAILVTCTRKSYLVFGKTRMRQYGRILKPLRLRKALRIHNLSGAP